MDRFPGDTQDAARKDLRWVALEELGTIARAVLLAAVAMAIGWAVSALVEGRMERDPAITAISVR